MVFVRSRYHEYYLDVIREDLINKGCKHPLPELQSVRVHCTYKYSSEKYSISRLLLALLLITGQRGKVNYIKEPVSNFNISKGSPHSAFVDLRGDNMYNFLDRVINLVLPKDPDFEGYSLNLENKHFNGNFTFGVPVPRHFIELYQNSQLFTNITGFDILIKTNARNAHSLYHLLRLLQFPVNAVTHSNPNV